MGKEADTTGMGKLLLLGLGKLLLQVKKIHQDVGMQCAQLHSGLPTHYHSNLEDSIFS